MAINPNMMISVTEATRDFARVALITEKYGRAVICENERPKFLLVDLDNSPLIDMTDDEKST